MATVKKTDTISARGSILKMTSKKHERVWLIVADACHARVLEGDLGHSGVALVLQAGAPRMSGASRTRAHPMRRGGHEPERHVVAPLQQLKTHEMQIFLSRLADYLAGNVARYDGLILVAPARVQQQMTRSFPKLLLNKVIDRHKEDLTWMTTGGILDHLGALGKQMQRVRRPANPLPFLKRRKSA